MTKKSSPKKVPKRAGWVAACAVLLIFMTCVSPVWASVNVWRVLVEPDGEIVGNQTRVTVTAYMDIFSEGDMTFSPDNTLRMWTDLEEAVWSPVISYDGRLTDLPLRRSKSITLTSWDLSYPSGKGEGLKVTLKGWAPGVGSDQDKTLLRIAEESPNGIINNSETIRTAKVLYRADAKREESPEIPAGSLHVTSVPAGARIVMGGEDKGVTPATLERVPAGNCTLALSLAGYHDAVLSVSVPARQTMEVSTNLIPGTGSGTGVLRVESSPAAATVVLDGTKKGITPLTIDALSPGTHALRLDLDGYTSYDGTVQVTAGGTITQSVHLTPLSPVMQPAGESPAPVTQPDLPGGVLITSNPPGADIILDGELKGITPLQISPLSPGPHTLKLSLPFFSDHTETFTLIAGEEKELNYSYELSEFQLPGLGAITGILSGINIGLPSLPSGDDQKSDAGKSDREKAYEDLMKQIGEDGG